ncbi:7317_t:CDS:2, partial [Gigaspora rosea]
EGLESENLDNEDGHASSSRNSIQHGRGRPRQASKGRRGCAHPYKLSEPSETPLTNIKLEFLPPHTTAHLQPIDAESWDEVETSTIVYCWVKTGILSEFSSNEIEDATFALQDLMNFEKDKNDDLIIDLTTNSLDLIIEYEINNFNDLNNSQILTEDALDKMQIVNIVLNEQREYEEGDTSDTDNDPPEVPIIEGLDVLKKFVNFFEQQKSNNFNVEDLK